VNDKLLELEKGVGHVCGLLFIVCFAQSSQRSNAAKVFDTKSRSRKGIEFFCKKKMLINRKCFQLIEPIEPFEPFERKG